MDQDRGTVVYDRRVEDRRLNRIENKLDELAKVLVTMARTEEKVAAMEEDKVVQWEVLNKLEAKLDIMEVKVNDAARTMGTLNKLFWVLTAAAAAYYLPAILQNFSL